MEIISVELLISVVIAVISSEVSVARGVVVVVSSTVVVAISVIETVSVRLAVVVDAAGVAVTVVVEVTSHGWTVRARNETQSLRAAAAASS